MRPVLAGVVAASLLVLGGCGMDVSQDDDVEPSVATVRPGLAALYAGGSAPADEGECFADALLDRVPLEDLVDADVVRDDGTVVEVAPMLDVEVAGSWVDAAASCAPYVEVAARAAAARSGVDETAYAACLGDAIAPERLREALVATLSGGFSSDPAAIELTAAEAGCAS